MDRCDECGPIYQDHPSDELATLGGAYRYRLATNDSAQALGVLTQRRAPDVWSVLEYACHVRDVLLAQRECLFLALVEGCPSFAPIYRDGRAVLARYEEEDSNRLADETSVASGLIARAFGGLDPAVWDRHCIYNFPEPAERSEEWLAQHTLHESLHHLFDIDGILSSHPVRQ